jgi:5-methylcytosine-specific restriction endonuclease McrA
MEIKRKDDYTFELDAEDILLTQRLNKGMEQYVSENRGTADDYLQSINVRPITEKENEQMVFNYSSRSIEDLTDFINIKLRQWGSKTVFQWEDNGQLCSDEDYQYNCVVSTHKLKIHPRSYILGEQLELDSKYDKIRPFELQSQKVVSVILLRFMTILLKNLFELKYEEERKRNKDRIKSERTERKRQISEAKQKRLVSKTESGIKINLRFLILLRDNFRCCYCGRGSSEAILQVDHIVPKLHGGADDPSNLITACRDCNLGKKATLMLAGKNKKKIKLAVNNEGQIPSFMALV